MPLTLDLLHEEHTQTQQRKRDPLKLGLYALGGVAALFVAYYGIRLLTVHTVNSQLAVREAEWKKQAPLAAASEKQEKESNVRLAAAAAVTRRVESRFYWAPLLDQLYKTVTGNVQLVSFSGNNELKDEKVKLVFEGIAGGREPRAAAEQFRISLVDRLGKNYPGSTATFRSLEESASTVTLEGKPMPSARFTIDMELRKPGALPDTATAEQSTTERHSHHT